MCFEPRHLVAEAGFELTSSCFNFPRAIFTRVNTKPKRELGLDVLPEFTPVSSRERSHSCLPAMSKVKEQRSTGRRCAIHSYWTVWLSSLYESKALDNILISPVFCSGEATPACYPDSQSARGLLPAPRGRSYPLPVASRQPG